MNPNKTQVKVLESIADECKKRGQNEYDTKICPKNIKMVETSTVGVWKIHTEHHFIFGIDANWYLTHKSSYN